MFACRVCLCYFVLLECINQFDNVISGIFNVLRVSKMVVITWTYGRG